MIFEADVLVEKIEAIRKTDPTVKIVFTNGCFDILHPGHVNLLSTAKLTGLLVVGVNSDESVSQLKGPKRPIQKLKDRMFMLDALQCVDFVTSFDDTSPLGLIMKLKPDYLVKGHEYWNKEIIGKEEVRAWGGEFFLVPMLHGFSTTDLVSKIESSE